MKELLRTLFELVPPKKENYILWLGRCCDVGLITLRDRLDLQDCIKDFSPGMINQSVYATIDWILND